MNAQDSVTLPKLNGKYHSFQLLGLGGMSRVYRAIHAELGLPFAIKVLSTPASRETQHGAELVAEAKMLLKFAHPNITQLRDFGRTEDGELYLAMDLCEGESLRDILDLRGRLGVEEATGLIIDLLKVLGEAHSVGIIHRDLKPDNLFLEPTNTSGKNLRVLDFGIAAFAWEGGKAPQGFSVGTPMYMAPEQVLSFDRIDARADIYSAGVVLYELLSGKVPFGSEDVVEILEKHLYQPVPALDAKLRIPFGVQRVIYRALAKNPAQRYQTASEFGLSLKAAVSDWKNAKVESNEGLWRVRRNTDENTKNNGSPLRFEW